MNDKVDIEIFKRRMTVEMEGLTPMEINALAQKVNERMLEISAQNKMIADSSKLAILSALYFAVELQKISDAPSLESSALERKVEELSLSLRAALSHVAKK